jgi:hypothetical protein
MQKNFFKFVSILKANDENRRILIRIRTPFFIGMDPRIRIHTKMSWIRNTGRSKGFSYHFCLLMEGSGSIPD